MVGYSGLDLLTLSSSHFAHFGHRTRRFVKNRSCGVRGRLPCCESYRWPQRQYPLDKHLHAQRHLVECCFSKLKQFRRVATRFEKTTHRRHSRCHRPMDAISVHAA